MKPTVVSSLTPARFRAVLMIAAVGILAAAGLAGLLRADDLYGRSTFFERQLVWLLFAAVVGSAAACIPVRSLRHFSLWVYLASVLLLVVVLFMPPVNGSRRWIPFGILNFQPSELARPAYILCLADYLAYRDSHKKLTGLLPPFALTVVPVLLILREPDLGTAMLFLPVLYTVLAAAGARLKHLGIVALAGILLLPVLWTQMSAEQRSRVTALFEQVDGGAAPTGDGYHLHQSKQVLALGGPFGSYFSGEPEVDDPAAWRLPAARTDFILCLIGERFGLPGIGSVLAGFALLIVCGLLTAAATREPFSRLAATGITTMLATQCIINSAMIVGLMPITGITLPFCSYGGSSLLFSGAAVGMLISICLRPGFDLATLNSDR